MKEQILIIDDDNDILELLEYSLSNAGYEVIGFLNTKHVRQILSEEKINLIIMDRSLPDIEGSLYIEMLRNKNINIPVIFVSAKDSLQDIKDGLTKGADDYITKPFDMEELLLRVKAVLKRYKQDTVDVIQSIEHKDIKLDLNLHKAIIASLEIDLTKLETALLKILIVNKNRVLDRNFLLKNVWHDMENINPKTVNVAIKRLKEKIDPSGEKDYIKTIRGVGYLLT
jgi:DNA-binding response OmpR family regulator